MAQRRRKAQPTKRRRHGSLAARRARMYAAMSAAEVAEAMANRRIGPNNYEYNNYNSNNANNNNNNNNDNNNNGNNNKNNNNNSYHKCISLQSSIEALSAELELLGNGINNDSKSNIRKKEERLARLYDELYKHC